MLSSVIEVEVEEPESVAEESKTIKFLCNGYFELSYFPEKWSRAAIDEEKFRDEFLTLRLNSTDSIGGYDHLTRLTSVNYNDLLLVNEEWLHSNSGRLLKSKIRPKRATFDECIESMKWWNISNAVIAGGAVVSSIFGTTAKDYDIFIWGLSETEANLKVAEIIDTYLHEMDTTIIRTENSISFWGGAKFGSGKYLEKVKMQIILRLYTCITEIIHGFDLDSSCICYDPNTKGIYLTERCKFAFSHMTNVVNMERTSSTYEYRLNKYRERGFHVFIPNHNKNVGESGVASSVAKLYHQMTKSADRFITDEIVMKKLKTNGARYYDIAFRLYGGCGEEAMKYLVRKMETKRVKHLLMKWMLIEITRNFSGLTLLLIFKKINPKYIPSDYEITKESERSSNDSFVTHISEDDLTFHNTYGTHLSFSIDIKKSYHGSSEGGSSSSSTSSRSRKLDTIFNIPTFAMELFGYTVPQIIKWKSINPGEQITGTFNPIKYDNPIDWYLPKRCKNHHIKMEEYRDMVLYLRGFPSKFKDVTLEFIREWLGVFQHSKAVRPSELQKIEDEMFGL
jgi:hypothetical protein